MADTKVEKPKGPIGKLKDAMDDKEEQLAILSTFVRLGILIWSGGILTLNYVTIPGWEQDKIDPTFIASVFTGVTATFGIQAGGKKKSGDGGGAKDLLYMAAGVVVYEPFPLIAIVENPLAGKELVKPPWSKL